MTGPRPNPGEGDPVLHMQFFDDRQYKLSTVPVQGHEVDGKVVPLLSSLISVLGVTQSENHGYIGQLGAGDIGFPCGLAIRPLERLVTFGDKEIPKPLTTTEFSILHFIATDPREPKERKDILLKVWGEDAGEFDTHVVDVHAANIKRKLGARLTYPLRDAPNKGLILTVRNIGFKMGPRAWDERPLSLDFRTSRNPR